MRSQIDKYVIDKIKSKREELNIPQSVLAEIIGSSKSFIGHIENKNSHLRYSATQIFQIAKYFGCSLSDIFPPIDPLEP